MRIFENATAPAVRAAELEIAGRRIAVRGIASSGEVGAPAFRFDPVERRWVARRSEGSLSSGPADPAPWAAAFSRAPAGPALVEGSSGGAEEVRGSFRAAAEGAQLAGRGTYLLDAPAAGLPVGPRIGGRPAAARRGAAPEFVLLCSWSPDADFGIGRERAEGIVRDRAEAMAAAAAAGIPSGWMWPVFPGWTDSEEAVVRIVRSAVAAGAQFASPIVPAHDVESRRAAVEARQIFDPAGAEAFFDTLFHSSWEEALPAALAVARRVVREAGISLLPPRPASDREPPANARAAALLEERALLAEDEHHSARLLAAARWIDACGRDLAAIWREGNLRRAFPLGAELAGDVERALEEAVG